MAFDLSNYSPKEINGPKNKKEKKHFQKHEKRMASTISGHTTKASGASGEKSDCVGLKFRVECKSTEKQSIRLEKEWLDKISKESRDSGREPVLSIQFTGQNSNWVLIRESLFEEVFNGK